MSFEKEDKAAWVSSEVMQELEKIAREEDILNSSQEKQDEKGWEEEDLDENLIDAVDEFNQNDDVEYQADDNIEYHIAYNNALYSKLQKIASELAEKSNIKPAYRIEQTIRRLKDIFSEDK